MKHLIYAIAFLSFVPIAHSASFDCAKASTLVEKTICSDPKLSELDSQLMQSYRKALATSPDASGLKAEQKAWLTGVRNKCVDAPCLTRVYSDRTNILTGTVASVLPTPTSHVSNTLTGTYKNQDGDLTSNGEVPKFEANETQLPISSGKTEPTVQTSSSKDNSPSAKALTKNAAKVSALGFPNEWLKATIYVQADMVNPPRSSITFEGFLAMLFDNPRISKITHIKSGKNEGVSIKIKGIETTGFLFNYDDGDIFPSHIVNGEDVIPLDTIGDKYSTSMTIMQLAVEAVK